MQQVLDSTGLEGFDTFSEELLSLTLSLLVRGEGLVDRLLLGGKNEETDT